MKIQINKSEKNYFVILSCIIVALLGFFYTLWPIAFTTHDDILNYAFSQTTGLISDAVYVAKSVGRWHFIITAPLSRLPYIFDNYYIYKMICYLSITFVIYALWQLMYKHTNKEYALLTVILFIGMAQIDNQHNLFVSYPLGLTIPIGFALLSLSKIIDYYNTKKLRDAVFSAVLLFVATVLYEVFILYSVIIFTIAFMYNYKKSKVINSIIKSLIELKYHIIIMSLYLAAYILFRIYYPSTYDGNNIVITSIKDSLTSMLKYANGLFPLLTSLKTIRNIGIHDSLSLLSFLDFFKAAVITMGFILAVRMNKTIELGKRKMFIIVSLMGIFLSVFLICLTSKYVMWAKAGATGYVPTFYSYFFIIIFIILILSIFNQYFVKKKLYLIFLGGGIFISCLITSVNNNFYSKGFHEQLIRYEMFDKALATDFFKGISDDSIIYIPEYTGIHSIMSFTEIYASMYSDKKLTFTNKLEELNFEKPNYMIHFNGDSKTVLMGKIDQNLRSDKVILLSNADLEHKSIILSKYESGPINYLSKKNNYGNIAFLPIYEKNIYEVVIESENIKIEDSYIVNGLLKENTMVNVEFLTGFYGEEKWEERTVYWSDNESILSIRNNLDTSMEVKFNFSTSTLSEEGIMNIYQNEKLIYTCDISNRDILIDFNLILEPGINNIKLVSDNIPMTGDGRNLAFYVADLSATPIEK